MHKVVYKRQLSHDMFWMELEAPYVAAKARPGQFIIFRVDEYGERVPLTMAGSNKEKGTVTIIFQAVGRSTSLLSQVEEGESIADITGPLGRPTEMEGLKRVCVVGGGTGNALAYPVAKGLHDAGVIVDMVSGFKTEELIVLEDEFKAAVDNFYLMTDDGTKGEKGFTTDKLKALIDSGVQYDEVITVGPPVMMKFVCKVTEPYGIKTIASLTALMIDGTGMCGGCRVSVGGETKYACVDGPEFDGQLVDWDTLIARNAYYMAEEQEERDHVCRLTGGVRHYE
ncbi:MAG: sulfide/dihydroorotate dehydrogenase-like FAD/NAD-binding protein [Eubacteriales bacterium]|jgi:ferredoxin--NADP+ reductase|uniref:Sulfide/dihydroorotate dehydrogenase-like FAD/NAD-binding protein n=1 Tax=Baileyella intestinalis TaxID=2606709 RepID=A0A6A8M7Y8_9FIRM|nr:sulfide/dihydroorotate dehydrogenase-like FAD/NAD-binding protein [Baileyella intestinalis]MCI7686079.1 sulfide/dihydroorotate dehydrogenase-like FAD/NAD-binding protein [Clostridiales bacterium]MDD5874508.1 sulfide/dihydroorotate dehydrogenase-like FAD/NAD-binding protein [Baileyella intestinalis]MDY2995221.1 sulfide/dihydroorotate dehydrogenase-like FAD/NAD-binding protein [Baileyella intestinalis]MST68810.1 sulfide/dihydroorotate dehydrogenase-like FAD/NAD-binding protein [Baileyella inte